MIGRLVALGAAVAAAAGAAVWAKRKADEGEDDALEQEIFDTVEDRGQAGVGGGGAAVESAGDDLTDIKGIGAVSAERLNDAGVTTFAEIAAWSDEDLEANSAKIKVSADRIRREDWVGQARAKTED
jgi:predicted flap endonuclease-1-like 5' DNA nuclease